MAGRIVVFVEGGVLTATITDQPGLEVMVIDYDEEEETGEIYREFEEIEYNPEAVEKAIAGTEND